MSLINYRKRKDTILSCHDLKLDKYKLRWAPTVDILQQMIICLTKTKLIYKKSVIIMKVYLKRHKTLLVWSTWRRDFDANYSRKWRFMFCNPLYSEVDVVDNLSKIKGVSSKKQASNPAKLVKVRASVLYLLQNFITSISFGNIYLSSCESIRIWVSTRSTTRKSSKVTKSATTV